MSDDDTGATDGAGRLAGFLPYQLSVTSNAVSDLIAERYRNRFALKIPEWRVMAVLGDTGAMTQRGLTAATLMDKVAVNRAVKVLEDRGLAARVANPVDGRSHLLALTEDGRAIHAEIMPLALAMEAELLSSFPPDQQTMLRDMLAVIRLKAGELSRGA
ncbi:MarR family winged helix-turn-helix transcriptional regulator [Erythrobacter dokdonensis]|uniref:Transcriptional regulator, MarR family protein n=1 Tax=Erythrobacter dokdonensis DSW-74 TaxID=1300349 RepID=A0A1A7BC34_9SPHN|nr:MarR family winged helix-turn-helix transcriptional regulator [Erythrobacter dokdonensis]OBV10059.1 Transcriptional regulator, MarR family protein [Erythrobacter dokdonensis DSW-74]